MSDDPIIRRPDDPPSKQPVVVRVYPGQPEPQPPPGNTQYIVIQNILPPGAQAAPQQTSPPPPIAAGGQFQAPSRPLYEQYARPRARGRSKGTSALGAVSLALGVIAIAAYWLPGLSSATVPVAMIGFILAALGWVLSILFGRSSAGVPFTGLIVCAVALIITARGPGGWRDWYGRLHHTVQSTIDQSIAAPGKQSTPGAATPSASAQATLRDVLAQVQAMFATADANVAKPPPISPTPAIPTHSAPSQPPPAIPPAAPPHPVGSPVAIALDHLNAARQSAQQRVLSQPNIVAALASASAAKQHVDDLRETAPGSLELRDASSAWMQSLQHASDLVRAAVEADPQVIAARQQYVAAYEADRAAAPRHSTTLPHPSGH